MHPTIFAAKNLIKAFAKEREIELICDLHGHSRRKNIFMYGCNDPEYPEATRAFPYLLSKLSHFFSYKFCSFRMQKSKKSTLRISIFTETKVLNTYTLESTFCGCDFGPSAGRHLTTEDLQTMGKQLCLAIIVNNNLKLPASISNSIQIPINLNKSAILEEIKNNEGLLIETSDSSSGSDSDPSEDNLEEAEISKLMSSPSPKRRISSDTKTKKKANLKKERLSFQLPLKKLYTKDKAIKIIKCLTCGENKELGHVCLRSKIIFSNTSWHTSFNQRSAKTKDTNIKRMGVPNLNKSISETHTYLNPEGKRVRDQASQTTAIISPRKIESSGNALYFLNISDSPAIISTDNVYRKSDVLENLVDIEKLKKIFKNDKSLLPSINNNKILTSEKFTKTY